MNNPALWYLMIDVVSIFSALVPLLRSEVLYISISANIIKNV